jgi:hypothetical protein
MKEWIKRWFARLRRFTHRVLHIGNISKHRPSTLWIDGQCAFIYCECGVIFHANKDREMLKTAVAKLREEVIAHGEKYGWKM